MSSLVEKTKGKFSKKVSKNGTMWKDISGLCFSQCNILRWTYKDILCLVKAPLFWAINGVHLEVNE